MSQETVTNGTTRVTQETQWGVMWFNDPDMGQGEVERRTEEGARRRAGIFTKSSTSDDDTAYAVLVKRRVLVVRITEDWTDA